MAIALAQLQLQLHVIGIQKKTIITNITWTKVINYNQITITTAIKPCLVIEQHRQHAACSDAVPCTACLFTN